MCEFFGTKRVKARPMTRGEYNKFRLWALPADEDETDDGYLVEYLDGGEPNIVGHAGYVSWSPRAQFENAYRPVTAMNFGHALDALKEGERVARPGWNGKGMWLMLIRDWTVHVDYSSDVEGLLPIPWIGMRTADRCLGPWLASHTDMLAEDWSIVT